MSSIKILPENLSNKIAAGEVVERPASVVKELVENALDAGSDRIAIEVEKGGRSLIQVADNGAGMTRDDAMLCIERYATSKITNDEDLFAISTLGFRGEALPSIAAVSRFTLVTRRADEDAGTEIRIAGGTMQKVAATGAPPGTMVSVRQLFYNTPARRKFLKSINTEMGHIVEAAAGIALGWPRVRLRLVHNGRPLKHWAGTASPKDRVVDVLGRDLQDDLHPLSFEDGDVSLSGWAASPACSRSTSRGIYIYVNGRVVRDRVVQHALFQGYAGRIVKGRFPVAVLFIRVPGDKVDVNVHPAKNEVRFAEQKRVHDNIRQCVSQALGRVDRRHWSTGYRLGGGAAVEFPGVAEKASNAFASGERDSMEPWVVTGPARPLPTTSREEPETEAGVPAADQRQPATGFPPTAPAGQQTLWPKKRFGDLRFVGQFHDTYLIFESDEGLVVIDQHAAHERIMYERLKKGAGNRTEKQVLLIPETMELNYREAAAMEKIMPELEALGFDVEPFGGQTFVIKSLPSLLEGREIKPLMREMVDIVLDRGDGSALADAVDDCLKIMACHGAIRANQALALPEINKMLEQLDACDNPSNCPHGRPTWINWPLSFVERAFKRIV
ncbi:MAG: DNA mismatch repair endonuclease MutL [Deltaproteobacteria bacterium]|nr:DNA mismatch repair endonuclease MutL [Deltaproteobacteria bacterium]